MAKEALLVTSVVLGPSISLQLIVVTLGVRGRDLCQLLFAFWVQAQLRLAHELK